MKQFGFSDVLNQLNTIRAVRAYDNESIESNRIYVAPPDHDLLIEQLFKRYYRAESKIVQTCGLSLGLYISAEIVDRHGGQIGVSSEVGKGSHYPDFIWRKI